MRMAFPSDARMFGHVGVQFEVEKDFVMTRDPFASQQQRLSTSHSPLRLAVLFVNYIRFTLAARRM